jgi:hypothetical protein
MDQDIFEEIDNKLGVAIKQFKDKHPDWDISCMGDSKAKFILNVIPPGGPRQQIMIDVKPDADNEALRALETAEAKWHPRKTTEQP